MADYLMCPIELSTPPTNELDRRSALQSISPKTKDYCGEGT